MRLITRHQVCDAVRTTLQTWMPYQLARTCEADGLTIDAVKQPREWRLPQSGDRRPFIDRLPLVVVTTTGIRELERNADDVDGCWDVIVACWTHEADYEDTARHAGVYAAAVASILDQHPSHGGLASDTFVTAIDLNAVDDPEQRTLGGVLVRADVWVPAVWELHGLSAPPADVVVEPETPTVETVTVTVEPEEG